MMKNKRGFEMSLENVLGLIIAIMVLVIVAPPVGAFFSDVFFGSDDKVYAQSQIEDLILTINSTKGEETYPLNIPSNWFLIKYLKNEESPNECANKNCLCICTEKKYVGLIHRGFDCDKGVCRIVDKEIKMESSIKIPSDITLKVNEIIEITGIAETKTIQTTKLSEEEKQDAESFDDYIKSSYPSLWVFGLGDCIIKAEKELGVPKELILGVALHESGRGTSGLSKSVCISKDGSEYSNNLFGITSGVGTAGKCNWPTWECYINEEAIKNAVLEGSTCTESNIKSCQSGGKNCYSLNRYFRAYKNKCDSVEDFARMISTSSKYKESLQYKDDIDKMINTILKGGYATDPKWAEQVIEISKNIQTETEGLA